MARVLVVDAEERLREYLAEALESDSHQVTTAADGVIAANLLAHQTFDLTLTDLKMPGLDGMGLLARARELQPQMEIVLLTSHGTVDSAVTAMETGAYDYLHKPVVGPAELRLTVARALERRRLRALVEAAERLTPMSAPLSYGAASMVPVVHALTKVAQTDATLLLSGESGTGKEIAARSVHGWSPRSAGPFVSINCASLNEHLLESELFGHERGASTGATTAQRGRIELADGGTFFVDEIGDLNLDLQAKLLRVIQERVFERIGGRRRIDVNIRWIAATNRDLEAMVETGQFREDLYHRLAVFPVRMPPLRDRTEDIVPLAETLLMEIAVRVGRAGMQLSEAAKRLLQESEFRGNVRELANALERAAITAESDVLRPSDFQLRAPRSKSAIGILGLNTHRLDEVERATIAAALAVVGGNRKNAAERLGIPVRTLYDRLKKYDLA